MGHLKHLQGFHWWGLSERKETTRKIYWILSHCMLGVTLEPKSDPAFHKEKKTEKSSEIKGCLSIGRRDMCRKSHLTKGLAVQNAPLKKIQLELNRFSLQFKAPTSQLMNTYAKSALSAPCLSWPFKQAGSVLTLLLAEIAHLGMGALLLSAGWVSLHAECRGSDVIPSF